MTATDGAIRLVMELRRRGVTNTMILSAVERTPREAFVPVAAIGRAWDDSALELGNGEILSRPFVAAVLIDALHVGERHRVLQLPTGTGYQATLLSHLCRWVYTREPARAVRQAAEARLRELDIHNVIAQAGEPEEGWPEQAPFDRILLSTGFDDAPAVLLDQLRPAGVLVAPLGPDPLMRSVTRITRTNDGFDRESLMALPPAVLRSN